MKVRAWEEERASAIILADGVPVPVQRGDVVVVAVASSWEDAARFIATLPKRVEDGRQD